MSKLTKQRIIIACVGIIIYLDAPGPREIYDNIFGGVRNPQYLFASSELDVCRRIRRVVDSGKTNIYIENLSSHNVFIYYTHKRLRATIMTCHKYRHEDQ